LLESELNAARTNAQTAWSAKEDLEAQLYARDSTIEALRQEKQALGDSLEAHADEVVRTKRALDSALAHNRPHIDHNNSE
jgi:small-conductance mechanosensitive channel